MARVTKSSAAGWIALWALLWALFLAFYSWEAFAQMPAPGHPEAVQDPRYCGEPLRNKDGSIKRSRAVLRKFVQVFPCPANLAPSTSCPGWSIDHTIPLASGGCDSIPNLTWLPDAIKSCSDDKCKDRWERKYHAIPRSPIIFKE